MTAYYNENDLYAAQWLCNLLDGGHIASGVVDTRSIEDVCPSDLAGFTQCHFFAGIGVWSRALRGAGWGDDRPCWTGSCPCQPFSAAGKGAGFDDERHLWPAWHHLIRECKPAIIFGEQVASKDAEPWIDLVQADMEALGYAFGAVPFPSAGVGAPHIRDRLYWVADSDKRAGRQGGEVNGRRHPRSDAFARAGLGGDGLSCIVADDDDEGLEGRITVRQRAVECVAGSRCVACELVNADGGNASAEREQRSGQHGFESQDASPDDGFVRTGPANGFWRSADWLGCTDAKWRPVEPGAFPLAHGAPSRMGRLRAYGNAINAEAARIFIESVMA